MSWRDDLRKASWRDLEFEVLSTQRTPGRVVAVHEFPQRDDIEGEDIRAATKSFSVEAYLIGSDYHTRRDAFEAALNTPGTGVLILPWTGQVTARLTSARATESSSEGGMVRYALEFVEEAGKAIAAPSPDTSAAATAAADALSDQAKTDFADGFTVAGQPSFVATGAASVLTQLSDRIDTLTAPLKGAGETLSGFVRQGQALRAQVLDLVFKPADLAAQVSDLIHGIRTVAATPGDALRVLSSLLGFGSGLKPVPGSTPARRVQQAAQAAISDLVARSCAAGLVASAAASDYASYQEAVATRDDIADRIDDLALSAADAGQDSAWRALVTARAAVIADITARGGDLKQLYSHTPPATVPALVLAHRLYPDAADLAVMVDDIVARNALQHPGFVPGGLALEVLSV